MKPIAVFILLFTAVPAGCLPVMLVGIVAGEFKPAPTGRLTDPRGESKAAAFITLGVFALLAIGANLLFRRMIRRTHGEEPVGPLGLSNAAWRFTLWGGFSAGVAAGVVMMLHILEIGS